MTDLRFSLPALVLAVGCALVVLVRAATVAAPAPRRTATPAERIELATAVAAKEPAWTTETTQNFPADNWSQRDDFHGREYRTLMELANQKRVRLEDVIRAVDDDLHAKGVSSPHAPDLRAARAVPCKPRPFYD